MDGLKTEMELKSKALLDEKDSIIIDKDTDLMQRDILMKEKD